jgi:hypothetical protein
LKETKKQLSEETHPLTPQTITDRPLSSNLSRVAPAIDSERVTDLTHNSKQVDLLFEAKSSSPSFTSSRIEQTHELNNQATEKQTHSHSSPFYLRATQTSANLATVKPRLEVSVESPPTLGSTISSKLANQAQSMDQHRTLERSQLQTTINAEPTIHITIGRVVVRGMSTPSTISPSQSPRSTTTEPPLSLEDYLRQREGGSA